jgi:hypothetical protein
MRQMELLKLSKKYNRTLQAGVAFENFPTLHGNFSNHGGACMATHTQKTKTTLYWMNGDHYKLTVASPRCDPGEHVLPIIRRLRWYAQLAGWLANPRRYSVHQLNHNTNIHRIPTNTTCRIR